VIKLHTKAWDGVPEAIRVRSRRPVYCTAERSFMLNDARCPHPQEDAVSYLHETK